VCVLLYPFCTRDRGCSAHPAFPAPSKGREIKSKTSGASRREGEGVYRIRGPSLRGAQATKQSSLLCRLTKAGLLRFARNDGGLVQIGYYAFWQSFVPRTTILTDGSLFCDNFDVCGFVAAPTPIDPEKDREHLVNEAARFRHGNRARFRGRRSRRRWREQG
jgi:hypothetical protein